MKRRIFGDSKQELSRDCGDQNCPETVETRIVQRLWRPELSRDCGDQNCPETMEKRIVQRLWRPELSRDCGDQNCPETMEKRIVQRLWRPELSRDCGGQNCPETVEARIVQRLWRPELSSSKTEIVFQSFVLEMLEKCMSQTHINLAWGTNPKNHLFGNDSFMQFANTRIPLTLEYIIYAVC